MPRPWIEFIQSQDLPWTADDLSGVRSGIDTKPLSVDSETGAASRLIRYPSGWTMAQAGALTVDEEFLVLDGALTIGDVRYGPKSYAHLPAGFQRLAMSSAEGAVVLTFFSANPEWARGTPTYDPARLIEKCDAFDVPYTGNFHPQFPPGAGRKMLYQDPLTGDQSWLLGTLPMRWAERSEVHPVVEEMYLLSGEAHGNRGVMRPGAYFWRPPNIPHGPYGTLTGNLYLFRTKGGSLSTDYIDTGERFHWWPEYVPVLPPELAVHARGQQRSPPCW